MDGKAFCLVACLMVRLTALSQTVHLEDRKIPVRKALQKIKVQMGYGLWVDGDVYELLDHAPAINLNLQQVSLDEALTICLQHTGISYMIKDKFIFIKKKNTPIALPASPASETAARLTIKVVNEREEVLEGANIQIDGTNKYAITNQDGIAHLPVLKGAESLTVAYQGYVSQHGSIGNVRNIQFALIAHPEELDETVVMAYGTTTKRLNTGNISGVSAREIEEQPVTSPLAALEGRVAGMVVTQSNGVPGAGFRVLVRGQNSLAQGTDPFFVIDGVPFAPNNTSLSAIPSGNSAGGLSPFNSIDPHTIETIEVLKDADATAIYGSRGANGVVLITTRKGKPGKPELQADLSAGASRITSGVKMMNNRQYTQMRLQGLKNDSLTPTVNTAPDLLLWDTTRNMDLQHTLIGGTAHTQDARISLSGGDLHTRYLVSMGYHDESTVFPGDAGYRRFSMLGSLSHNSRDNRLLLQLSLLDGFDRNRQFTSDLTNYRTLAPNAPPLTDSMGHLVWQEHGLSFSNPLSYAKDPYLATTGNVLVNGSFSYRVIPRWTLRMGLGYNRVSTDENSTSPIAAQDPANNPTGSSYSAQTSFRGWTFEPQSEYKDSIDGGVLDFQAGATLQTQQSYTSTLTASGFVSDALLQTVSAAPMVSPSSNETDYHYEALFGRLNYNWKNTYLINFSGRRDGSSRFGPGRSFGNFGALGAGWIFSNLAHLREKLPVLSFGKIRASYGTTGNDQIGDYKYLALWSATSTPSNQSYQGIPGFYTTALYNPELAWETIRKSEIVLELGFFHDRIIFNTSWYRNRSNNQLIPYALPFQTGFGSVLLNFPAVLQNSGLEFSLMTKNINSKRISWTTHITLSIPRDKLLSFPGLDSSSYANQYAIGRSIHIIRGYTYTGVDPVSGVFGFGDKNSGQKIVGQQDITTYGGIYNSLRLGNWELDLFLDARRQTGVNAMTSFYGINIPGMAGYAQYSNQPAAFLQRWQQPGNHAPFERFTTIPGSAAAEAAQTYINSKAYLTDASFIRIKTISLVWNFPVATLQRFGLAGGSVYLQGQNLWTIAGYQGADPETQNILGLPPLRTVMAGFKMTFK